MKKSDINKASLQSGLADMAGEQPKSVMLVEDDATHRAFMTETLQEAGFLTIPINDGLSALMMLDSGRTIDLIIMDWDMPDMNGLETVRHIRMRQHREGLQHIPILAFTSHRLPGDRERCIAAGMDAYLPKTIWMPKWRKSLIDNLQKLIEGNDSGNFYLEEFVNDKPIHANFNPDEFNIAILQETKALLKEKFSEVVEEYLEDAALYISRIKDGLAEQDKEKVAQNSHPLKSNSKGFGLMGLAGIAEAINLAALQAIESGTTLAIAEDLFPQMADVFARAEKKLRAQI